MPVFADLRLVVYLGIVAGMRRAVELNALPHELRGVFVGRRHVYVEARRGALNRKRPHHVVRLETVDAHDGDPERLCEFECVWNRSREILWHLLALRLVLRIRLVAESRPAWVHGENGMCGFLALKDRLKPGREPKQRRGVDPSRSKTRISEKYKMPFVEKGHHVDYEQLTHLPNSIA